ncbi:hypothetical protein B0H13DRAFT_1884524 [Mycena leptocephala]|nr:hypothetical protein B0H13DRAFT_1884524 [Mycena leptocephala]
MRDSALVDTKAVQWDKNNEAETTKEYDQCATDTDWSEERDFVVAGCSNQVDEIGKKAGMNDMGSTSAAPEGLNYDESKRWNQIFTESVEMVADEKKKRVMFGSSHSGKHDLAKQTLLLHRLALATTSSFPLPLNSAQWSISGLWLLTPTSQC